MMKYVAVNREQVEAIQLSWENWNAVCEFVNPEAFAGGIYLDDETFEPLPNGGTSDTIGLKLHGLEGVELVRQGDYVVRTAAGVHLALDKEVFARSFKSVTRLFGFDEAVRLLKEGKKVRRAHWGGYWFLDTSVRVYDNGHFQAANDMIVARLKHNGGYVPATPYQEDVLAEDWELFE